MRDSSNPPWIVTRRWLVQIVVSAASGASCEDLPELDSTGAFSFSMPHPPLPSPALSLNQDLFVFSHGLMSHTQVSLIINDPWVVGPLRLLRSLTWCLTRPRFAVVFSASVDNDLFPTVRGHM